VACPWFCESKTLSLPVKNTFEEFLPLQNFELFKTLKRRQDFILVLAFENHFCGLNTTDHWLEGNFGLLYFLSFLLLRHPGPVA